MNGKIVEASILVCQAAIAGYSPLYYCRSTDIITQVDAPDEGVCWCRSIRHISETDPDDNFAHLGRRQLAHPLFARVFETSLSLRDATETYVAADE